MPIIAAIVGVAIVGGVSAVALLGTKNAQTPSKQVATSDKPHDAATPEIKPDQGSAAVPIAPPDRGSAIAQVAPDQGSAIVPTADQGSAHDPTNVAKTATKPSTGGKRVVTTTKVAKTTVETAADPHKAETKTTVETPVVQAPKPPPDANAIANQYKAVGAQLKALEDAKGTDAASDLWSRYRLIRIVDAMSTQPKRDEAAAVLAKLSGEIAKRRK